MYSNEALRGWIRSFFSLVSIAFSMKPIAREAHRNPKNVQGESSNWILIAGGALLSSLSICLGYKLKQVLDSKQANNSNSSLKAKGKSIDRDKSRSGQFHSNLFYFPKEEDGCCNGYTGSKNVAEMKQYCNGQMMTEPELALPLATVPNSNFSKDNDFMWSSSPDRLQLPRKPLHHSNSYDSPCVSESGSDIFSKQEVIQKLRQQLKRRDDMVLEMQDQIAELHSSINSQLSHSSHLQSLLDMANGNLIDSEREIQRLRKAIADQCSGHVNSNEKLPKVPVWPVDGRNGPNGYPEVESNSNFSDVALRDGEKIEKLKGEIKELKELIEGKDYLLHNYKEQKSELSLKIKELQLRLDSQLPNIL